MICRSASLLALGFSLAGSLLLASPVQAAKRIDEIDEVLDQSKDAMPSPRFLPSPVELAKRAAGAAQGDRCQTRQSQRARKPAPFARPVFGRSFQPQR